MKRAKRRYTAYRMYAGLLTEIQKLSIQEYYY